MPLDRPKLCSRPRAGTRLYRLWLPAVLLTVWSAEAVSQNSPPHEDAAIERLFTCVDLEPGSLRLQCYDSIMRPLADARPDPDFGGESTIEVFSGQDDLDIELITIEQPWRLRWALDGSMLSVELREGDNSLIDIIGNQIGAGHGASAKTLAPGSYRIAVRAIGAWQLAIEPE